MSTCKIIKWPEIMPSPTAQDFVKGSWKNECGTKFCAVGMVCYAFGEPENPNNELVPDPEGETTMRLPPNTAKGEIEGPLVKATWLPGWDGKRDSRGGHDQGSRERFNKTTPVGKFVHSFAKHLGADMDKFTDAYEGRGLYALSWLFEDGECLREGMDIPDEQTAAIAFNQALKDHGYTVDTKFT